MDAPVYALDLNEVVNGLVWFALLVANLAVSYLGASIFSQALRHNLSAKQLTNAIVRYGAMTSNLWESVVCFICRYLKWYLTFVLTVIGFDFIVGPMILSTGSSSKLSEMMVVIWGFEFLSGLFWFICLTVAGLVMGGVVFKVVREGLEQLGLHDQMSAHGIEGAFGGLRLSEIIGGICKWYIVLLFMNEGSVKLDLPILSKVIGSFVDYIPDALSGLFILLASLLIAKFAASRIKLVKLSFAELLALGVQATIVFFGLVLSLPIFVDQLDVSILTDSFKIMVVGVSMGTAIALGLGLKDGIADLSMRYEKRF